MTSVCEIGSVLGFHVYVCCTAVCISCFLFTLFSWEGESLCLELELHVVNYMQLWDDRMSRNMWDF